MKASELMIEDLVYNHRKWVCPIVEIHKDSAVVIARHYGEEEFKLDDLRPIPLTPEILEKIGFVKYIAGQYVLPKMVGEIFVSIMPMKGLPNANAEWLVAIKNGYTDVRIPITYIHELQHALKLCGINKEITL